METINFVVLHPREYKKSCISITRNIHNVVQGQCKFHINCYFCNFFCSRRNKNHVCRRFSICSSLNMKRKMERISNHDVDGSNFKPIYFHAIYNLQLKGLCPSLGFLLPIEVTFYVNVLSGWVSRCICSF